MGIVYGVGRPFDSYFIVYSTSGGATIYCEAIKKRVGTINFVREDEPIPKSNIKGEERNLYFPISRFNDIISIIRYEKPLTLNVYDTGAGYLSTITEPVGEQE